MNRRFKNIISVMLMLSMIVTLLIPVYGVNTADAETKRAALEKLGLFKSEPGKDYEPDRVPTRTEALIMLIRVLGKESEALRGNWKHPFTDVDASADKYIGYAYEKGITKGVSETSFGTENADLNMFLTFMLHALNYDEKAGDFTWKDPRRLAAAIGILPYDVDVENFTCKDIVLISWAVLEADLKGGNQRFAKKLMSEGVFTGDVYGSAIELVNKEVPKPVSVSSAEALKSALGDKNVKYISLDSIGTPVVVKGTLAIPAGVTVTVNRGNDFYIEGTLTNNGVIDVMGADSISKDFINYSVMCIQNEGKVINNGAVILNRAITEDTEDYGPIGGQLRINKGTFDNNGSLLLKAGAVNTHGGMGAVIDGTFINNAIVIIDGFFFRVEKGTFINSNKAVIINNSHIFKEDSGKFTNEGIITGNGINN